MEDPFFAVFAPSWPHWNYRSALEYGLARSVNEVARKEAIVPVLGKVTFEMDGDHIAKIGGAFHLHADLMPDKLPSVCTNEILRAVLGHVAVTVSNAYQNTVAAIDEVFDSVAKVHATWTLCRSGLPEDRLQTNLWNIERAQRGVAPGESAISGSSLISGDAGRTRRPAPSWYHPRRRSSYTCG